MAVGARFLMLTIVSVAAVVAIAWLTFWAFNPAAQGRRSCALCTVTGTCDATLAGGDAEGACGCPQGDGHGCFTGAFTCPPGFTLWADNTLTGTCHQTTAPPSTAWITNAACTSTATAATCAARGPNDCCCVVSTGGPPLCAPAAPGVPPLTCQHLSLNKDNWHLDAVPMGLCQVSPA